jgi:hypothetical protein
LLRNWSFFLFCRAVTAVGLHASPFIAMARSGEKHVVMQKDIGFEWGPETGRAPAGLSTGMVVIDLTPAADELHGVHDATIRVDETSVVATGGLGGLCYGCVTTFTLALEADKFSAESMPAGVVDGWPSLFGEHVNFVHPDLLPQVVGVYSERRELSSVEPGSMLRSSFARAAGRHRPWAEEPPGKGIDAYRLAVCVVFAFKGCALGKLEVQASLVVESDAG